MSTLVPDDPIAKSSRGVESRGIEHIPADERRGTVAHLGAMWSGLILNVQVVVYGALLVSFGLNPWQCLLAVLIGNLTWIVTGICSLPGPAAGQTTFAISRASFGRNGNRPIAFFNWVMQVGYEVLDLVLMVLAVTSLLDLAGVHVNTTAKVALAVALSIAQSVLPVFGHAAITKVLRLLIVPCAALFLVLAYLTAERLHLPSSATAGWGAFLGAVALSASASGLGWTPNAADFSRYLPATTSRRGIAVSVALGGAIPQVLLMLLGVGVAFVSSAAADPISGLTGAYPSWFVVLYLLLLIVQLGSINAFDLYSSGVTLQAIGLNVKRWQAVVIDGAVSTVIALVVIFSGDINTYLSNFLLFMIIWFGPWSAIFAVDYFLRRGRYDTASLDSAPGGRYRRPGGLHSPGVIAQVAGMVAAALWINTSVFIGPLSAAGNGIDLSVPAGLLVGGIVYYLLARRSVAAESPTPTPIDQEAIHQEALQP
jgi:NCS1 family nucleobase:cation symporter-1